MRKKQIKSIFSILYEKRLTTVAGAWVYYFLTSLIPLVFLLVSAFSVFGVSLTNDLVSRLPLEFRLAGETIARTAENASKGATVFFIVTVIFSSSNLLSQMSKDGDFIYGIRSKHKRGIMRRIFSIIAIGFLFSIFLFLAFVFAFGSTFSLSFFSSKNNDIILTFLSFLFVILIGYAIIIMLNTFISPIKIKISNLFLGSFISLFIIVLGTLGFTIYLKFFANYNAFYGSLAGIIIFMIWAYIVMFGLAVGVVINKESLERKKSREKNNLQKRAAINKKIISTN